MTKVVRFDASSLTTFFVHSGGGGEPSQASEKTNKKNLKSNPFVEQKNSPTIRADSGGANSERL